MLNNFALDLRRVAPFRRYDGMAKQNTVAKQKVFDIGRLALINRLISYCGLCVLFCITRLTLSKT